VVETIFQLALVTVNLINYHNLCRNCPKLVTIQYLLPAKYFVFLILLIKYFVFGVLNTSIIGPTVFSTCILNTFAGK